MFSFKKSKKSEQNNAISTASSTDVDAENVLGDHSSDFPTAERPAADLGSAPDFSNETNGAADEEGSSDVAFEAVNLSFEYPGSDLILKNISLKIYKGEFTIIAGLNGSGKSTFAYHLNGLLRPTSGRMLVWGKDTRFNKHIPEIHRKVGIVFQNPYTQFVGNTVEEDIAFGPENLGLGRKEIRERVDAAMDAVHIRDLAFQDPSSLSGGEAQAAAIAGVLAMDPECIVFDEVTSMLDYAAEDRVSAIVNDLRERGKTIVCITHEPKELLKADRIIVFEKGEVVFDGGVAAYVSSEKYRLPDVVKLMKRLHEEGCDVSELVSNPEQAAEEIIAYFKSPRPFKKEA